VLILKNNGIEPEIRDYIKEPLSVDELKDLAKKLDLRPQEFIRKKEAVFKELGLGTRLDNDEILFKNMAENPRLMERPIIVYGNKAVLGRPPEKVLELI